MLSLTLTQTLHARCCKLYIIGLHREIFEIFQKYFMKYLTYQITYQMRPHHGGGRWLSLKSQTDCSSLSNDSSLWSFPKWCLKQFNDGAQTTITKSIPDVNDSFAEEVLSQFSSCSFLCEFQRMTTGPFIYWKFKKCVKLNSTGHVTLMAKRDQKKGKKATAYQYPLSLI